MKLGNYLLIRITTIFVLILICWSVIYFFFQMKEIHEGIDEGLSNLRQEFVSEANIHPDFVTDMQKYNPLNIIVEDISYEEARDLRETYSTTQIYFPTEDEDEEVRMLTTAFYSELNGKYYRLKIFTSNVESGDMVESMLYLLIILWITLALALILATKIIIAKSNKPFYQLLDEVKKFELDNTKMIDFPETSIYEYSELNTTIKKLLEENIKTFTEQKDFIENASHELQTPLAIASTKLELMLQQNDISKEQSKEIIAILSALNRMRRLNSNLLLLSKIRNKQFIGSEQLDLYTVFNEVVSSFDDLIEHRKIRITVQQNGIPIVRMNRDLAYTMATNLLKNSITHNIKGGQIEVCFEEDAITIINDGAAISPDTDIFERYVSVSDNNSSSGLGLSIVKSITDHYQITIRHTYNGKHEVRLLFNKK